MPEPIKQSVLYPTVFKQYPQIAAGISTRHGGVSQYPFASLNMDNKGPDEEALRDENRRIFCNELGFAPDQLVRSLQVHGTEILIADKSGYYDGFDAIVTDKKGLLIGVSIADCTPILLFDSKNDVIAAIHAGWKGTVGQLVAKTLQTMHQLYSTMGHNCVAYIGPCIDECSFEVGEEVAVQFDTPFKTWNNQRGKYMIDLKKANAAQLLAFEIPQEQIEISPFSTVLNNTDFFSYRHENGITGRMLAAIGLD
jgi:polyphenol oxidase